MLQLIDGYQKAGLLVVWHFRLGGLVLEVGDLSGCSTRVKSSLKLRFARAAQVIRAAQPRLFLFLLYF